MIEDQLALLASIFSARRDSTNCEAVWTFFHGSDELFDIICSLWPELSNPTELQFLFRINHEEELDPESLLVGMLEADEELICMVEMDSDTVRQRLQAISEYAARYMQEMIDTDKVEFSTIEGERLRKRLVISNELNDQLPMKYRPIWQGLIGKDKKLSHWVDGIVEPLNHFNLRCDNSIKIKEFERMDPLTVFEMILSTQDPNASAVLDKELMPYMVNGAYCELFLQSFFTEKNFLLNTAYNFEVFSKFIERFELLGKEARKYLERVKRQCAYIVFKNGPNYQKIGPKSELDRVLVSAGDGTPVGELDITVSTLLHYSDLIDNIFHGYHLQDLYTISRNNESMQTSQFMTLARTCLKSISNEEITIVELGALLNHGKASEELIFSNLSETKQLSLIIEILLEFGNFSFLHKLITAYQYKVSQEILEKYFWHFFNLASGGQRYKAHLVNAEKIVDLLLQEDQPKYISLKVLVNVARNICDYSIDLGGNIPFRPSHVLRFKEDPFKLISLLLESNHKLYKNIPVTYSILQRLLVAFEITQQGSTDTEENLVKILVLHIDHALVNMDFQFAFERTRELLKKNNITDYWPTILQVGKFVDPNWCDGEAPTEVILCQLEILGELLQICPVDQIEAVASQWSAVELEFSTRDIIKDPKSLEKSNGLDYLIQNAVSLNGVSSTFANFLSRS